MKEILTEERKTKALNLLASIRKDVEDGGARSMIILRVHECKVDVSWIGMDDLQVIGALERAKYVYNLATDEDAELMSP